MMMNKEKFTEKVEQLYKDRLDQYWSNPRINPVGGTVPPTDRDINEWYIEAFLEAALEAGLEVEEIRDDSDSCYHAVKLKAGGLELRYHAVTLKAAGLELRYVDCVCGDHGPRNAELVVADDANA